ncbi:MAG TPA: DUF3098 domain-containing protein [Phaeodactylibacter sp.]|nr:DUF3098 domain-containing protein [Phaeodactylibacter sp.]
MSRSKQQRKKVVKKVVATTPKRTRTAAKIVKEEPLLFEKPNYTYMLIGAGLVALGMIMMLGGAMPDPNTWDPSIIYAKRITILGPMLILAGLVVEIFAIFKKQLR